MILLTIPLLLHQMADDLKEKGDKLLIREESSVLAASQHLEKTIEKSYETPLLDEFFRFQIWNLSEALKKYPDPQGFSTLDKAIKRYTALKREITLSLRKVKDPLLSFDPDYQTIIELAEHPDRLAANAKTLEQKANLGSWKKGKARCGPTARGILYHFLTRYGAPDDAPMAKKIPGAQNLLNHLQEHKDDKALFVYYIDSDRLDHVFVIQQTPRRDYCVYQSYVNQYSLEASLSTMTPMNYEEITQFVTQLTALDEIAHFSPAYDEIYETLFHTKMPKSVRERFSERKPDLKFISLPYYKINTAI